MNAELQAKNRKVLLRGTLFVCAMFAFGFAMVPLYDLFCDITGLNGKVSASKLTEHQQPDLSRSVAIQFVASNNENMSWEFRPVQKGIDVHPGGRYEISFYARNPSDRTMQAQSVPSVTPAEASLYLEKIECFCFSSQTLAAGEAIEMPVIFYFRNDLPDHIETVTMAWTLFDITGDNANQHPEVMQHHSSMNHGDTQHGSTSHASVEHEGTATMQH